MLEIERCTDSEYNSYCRIADILVLALVVCDFTLFCLYLLGFYILIKKCKAKDYRCALLGIQKSTDSKCYSHCVGSANLVLELVS